jgi:diaminohydroxyphosphoribosylaminopyrimidine deaminase/5-amino-6-(5-phosphoribosylamino)uracil reductase
MTTDEDFMQMALDLARQGEGFTSPNPMVGAVVVRDGRVVGRGYHEKLGGPHAEVNAIEDAGEAAAGATLYVTLEPCNHAGRTPPCTHRILKAGLRRVVAAMEDPNPEVTGGGNRMLSESGIEVSVGVCEAAARRLNEVYLKYVRTRLPFVIVKSAATLDGRIATRTGDSRWVTGKEARGYVHRLRHAVDGILVGINTVIADDPSLTARLPEGGGRDPVRLILDTHLRIPPAAKVLRLTSASDTILVTGRGAAAERRSALERPGVRVLPMAEKEGVIDLRSLMERLGGMGLCSVLIEGGSRVCGAALRARIADKVCFFYAPKILGGDDGTPICSGPSPERMRDAIALHHVRVRQFGADVMIEGYPG